MYATFLIAELGRIKGIFNPNLEYDLLWETAQAIYQDFLISNFNDPNKGEYDCISDYLNHLKENTPTENNTNKNIPAWVFSNLCYYDKRNPDCTADDEDIEDHKQHLLRLSNKLGYTKTCSCDNCFYGRTKLAEYIILN